MEDTNHLILRVSNCGQILNLGGCILDSFYGQSRGRRELRGGNPNRVASFAVDLDRVKIHTTIATFGSAG